MSTNIKLKRSAVAGRVPQTSDLELGELAINTYDGKLYLKKDDGTQAIVDVSSGLSASEILTLLQTVDGSGSGLDADTVDGIQAASFLRSDAVDVLDAGNQASPLVIRRSSATTGQVGIQFDVPGTHNRFFGLGTDGNPYWATDADLTNGFEIWHGGNDGTGSGLDADLLDGQQGTYYLDFTNATNIPDPNITVTLSGDVAGSANTTLTNLANGSISIATTIQPNSVALGTDTTGNYVASITNGSYITGGNGGSESAALTLAVDATSTNTVSKVVARDASGNFSAGTITATSFSGPLTGNASTASTWQTARTVTLGGVLSGSVSIDGSANVTLTAAHTSDPVITLTGAVTGSGTMTNLGSVSIATTATADPTLTLSGDATGSATFTNLGNATLTVAIVDDSHNHSSSTGNFTVGGDLIVNGTTFTVNATTVSIDDPIITLGGDTVPAVDDNKDRGIEFRWHNGTAAKIGFFGFDDSTGYLTFIPDATNTSEVFSGTAGDIQATNFRGALIGNASTATTLQTARTIGGVSFNGSANINLPGVNTTGNQNTTGSAATLTTARAIQVSGAVTGTANFDGSAAINIVTTATADPTLTLAGDATGSATFTNLGNATLTVAIVDNSHSHTVSNISDFTTGANTAIDNRVTKSFVDALNVDADTLDGLNSTQFLRSDANDTMTGTLTITGDLSVKEGGHTASTSLDWVKTADLGYHDYFSHLFTGTGFQKWSSGAWGNWYYWASGSASGEVLTHRIESKGNTPTSNKIEIWDGTVWNRVLTTADEGTGNGLDADTVDGIQASALVQTSGNQTISGTKTFSGELTSSTDGNGITLSGGGRFYKKVGDGLYIRKPSGGQELKFEDNAGNFIGTFWHSGNDGAASGLDADLLDGQEGTYYQPASTAVTTTTITNHTLNPRFATTIGFGNDSEILRFNDSNTETRTDYWTSKDGFYIQGDGNSVDAVVLKTGNLDVNQNAWINGRLGVGGDFYLENGLLIFDNTAGSIVSIGSLAQGQLDLASDALILFRETDADPDAVKFVFDVNNGKMVVNGTSGTPTYHLEVNGTALANQYRVGSTAAIDETSATLTTTSQTVIGQWSTGAFSGGKYLIQATRGGERHITELLITHNGTTAVATEYGSIWTSSSLATYEVDISGGNFRILATGTSSTSTVYEILEIHII